MTRRDHALPLRTTCFTIEPWFASRPLEWFPMKPLLVFHVNGVWYGGSNWKHSGSGNYREISRIPIPQTRDEIIRFAAENHYAIK